MTFVLAGHRGAMALAPENTLPSFALAAELGVTELEIDLRLSRDGEVVVIHDATVDRTTNGSGAVSDMTYAELRALDAGNGEPIPTFTDVLDATDLPLQLEIKDPAVIDPVMELLADRESQTHRLAPTSFNPDSVRRMAKSMPNACVGLIHQVASLRLIDEAQALGARRVLVGLESADADFVSAAHGRGLRVDLWPVNTASAVQHAVDLGVNGFTTDDPRVVAAAGYTLTDAGLARA